MKNSFKSNMQNAMFSESHRPCISCTLLVFYSQHPAGCCCGQPALAALALGLNSFQRSHPTSMILQFCNFGMLLKIFSIHSFGSTAKWIRPPDHHLPTRNYSDLAQMMSTQHNLLWRKQSYRTEESVVKWHQMGGSENQLLVELLVTFNCMAVFQWYGIAIISPVIPPCLWRRY